MHLGRQGRQVILFGGLNAEKFAKQALPILWLRCDPLRALHGITLFSFGQQSHLISQARPFQFLKGHEAPQQARVIRQEIRQFRHDLFLRFKQLAQLLDEVFIHFGNLSLDRIEWRFA